jgi:cation transport regulator ChaC
MRKHRRGKPYSRRFWIRVFEKFGRGVSPGKFAGVGLVQRERDGRCGWTALKREMKVNQKMLVIGEAGGLVIQRSTRACLSPCISS